MEGSLLPYGCESHPVVWEDVRRRFYGDGYCIHDSVILERSQSFSLYDVPYFDRKNNLARLSNFTKVEI